jgi:sugar (pentulose or hexulose) kinase
MLKSLAFDFGASSGKAILSEFDGEKISLREIHRFSNDPVMFNGTLYWDILRLMNEMKHTLIRCYQEGHQDLASASSDTWGVDFGLLDKNGQLIANPCTTGIKERTVCRRKRQSTSAMKILQQHRHSIYEAEYGVPAAGIKQNPKGAFGPCRYPVIYAGFIQLLLIR